MTKAPFRPALAALTFVAALWCAPDADASGMRAADPRGVARPVPAVGDIVTTPLCEGFNLGNSLDASGIAPGRPWWLSRDPLGEIGGLNLYGFVSNDPVNRWDYLGLSDELVISSTGGAYWVASRKGWFGKEIWRFPIGKRDGANNISLSSSAGFFDDGGGLVTERDLRRMIEAQNLVYEPYVDDDYETIEDYHPDVQKLMNGYLSRVPRADQKRNGFGNAGELFSHARALQEADAMFGGGIFDDGQRRGLERANAFGSDVVEAAKDARDVAAREGALTVATGGAFFWLRRAKQGVLLGVPEQPFNRAMDRLHGLKIGDNSLVESVEIFGSRAGSKFRGRGPTSTSDLDVLVTLKDMKYLDGGHRQQEYLERVIREIADDFEDAAEFPLQLIIRSPTGRTEFIEDIVKDSPLLRVPGG